MRHANNRDVRIRYEETGTGEAILLHHGFSDSLESWEELGWVDGLKPRYRVVRLDARGHGKSDKPHDAEAYAMNERIGDVLAVLDALEIERAHFVGYSLGGRVGWELAGAHPDRVQSLVLGGAHPFAQSMESYRRGTLGGAGMWARLVEEGAGALSDGLRARLLANDAAALLASVARDRPDRSEVIDRIRGPALLFCGTDDPLRPEIERAAFLLPRAYLLQVTGYDHLKLAVHLEQVLSGVRSFVDRHARPAGRGD